MAADVETLTLSISTGLLGAVSTLVGVWLKGRIPQKTTVENQPLVVKGADNFVSRTDFDKHVEVFGKHVEADEGIHKELFKLDREREKGNSDAFQGIARQLGVIEGKVDLIVKGKE